jgi:hypothetical protein
LDLPRANTSGGCELLVPSRPGYLRTPLESGRTPEDQADLYAAMLDSLEIERAAHLGGSVFEVGALVWLSHQIVSRRPALMTSFVINGMSEGLTKRQKRAAADGINSDPARLQGIQTA